MTPDTTIYATVPMALGEVHLYPALDAVVAEICERTEDNVRAYLGARVKHLEGRVRQLEQDWQDARSARWDFIAERERATCAREAAAWVAQEHPHQHLAIDAALRAGQAEGAPC